MAVDPTGALDRAPVDGPCPAAHGRRRADHHRERPAGDDQGVARRNGALVGVLLAVFVSLLSGFVISTRQCLLAKSRGGELGDSLSNEQQATSRARTAEEEALAASIVAREESIQSGQVSGFPTGLYSIGTSEISEWNPKELWSMRCLVERGNERILADRELNPRVRVAMMSLLGECELGIGGPARAADAELESYRELLAWAEDEPQGAWRVVKALRGSGGAQMSLQDPPGGARTALERGLALAESEPDVRETGRMELLTAWGGC